MGKPESDYDIEYGWAWLRIWFLCRTRKNSSGETCDDWVEKNWVGRAKGRGR